MSPSGGATVNYKGKTYDTDENGNIKPDTGRPITTSQADTLPPSNQVASLDDDEAMRIALEQQNQSRDPNQRNMDPRRLTKQAEQAGHYAFTHSGGATPAAPVGAGPLNLLARKRGRVVRNLASNPILPYVPPQQGPGGPNPTPGPDVWTAAALQLRGRRQLRRLQHLISEPLSPCLTTVARAAARGSRRGHSPSSGWRQAAATCYGCERSVSERPPAEITRQSNPLTAADPRFVQIYQPNIARTGNAQGGRGGDSNAPMMGALNLSWGPNLPVDQRGARNNIVLASSQGDRAGQTVPAPMPPPRPSDAPDMSALADNSFDVTAARKGGPCARRSRVTPGVAG